jgi:DHA1 family tetracycline resistance protein-like MFS transporter
MHNADTSQTKNSTKNSTTIAIVFATILIDMLGVGILIPVIPLLLTDPQYAYHLPVGVSTGYVILGYLTAIFPFMQFIATPILGQLSDHVGRKKVLAFSLAGTALSYVIFAIGIILKNIPLLFISRALDGITGGNIAVAQAAIADSSAPENRAKSFGLIGAAFGIGFIIGPFLGGVLSNPGYVSWFNATTPFWFAAILSALNTVSVMFFFKETLKKKVSERIHIAQSVMNIKAAFTSEKFRTYFITQFLYICGFTFFTTFFGVYLIHKFGYDQGGIGLYFAYIGVFIALTQGFVVRYMSKRFSAIPTIWISMLGLSIVFLVLSLINAPWPLYIIAIPQCIFIGLIMANMTALVSIHSGGHEQGKMLGVSASVQALAQAIPPVISGYLAASLSVTAPLVGATILVFCAALTFVIFVRPKFQKVV